MKSWVEDLLGHHFPMLIVLHQFRRLLPFAQHALQFCVAFPLFNCCLQPLHAVSVGLLPIQSHSSLTTHHPAWTAILRNQLSIVHLRLLIWKIRLIIRRHYRLRLWHWLRQLKSRGLTESIIIIDRNLSRWIRIPKAEILRKVTYSLFNSSSLSHLLIQFEVLPSFLARSCILIFHELVEVLIVVLAAIMLHSCCVEWWFVLVPWNPLACDCSMVVVGDTLW